MLQLTNFYITPNETCLLQIHPSTLRKLPCHEYFDTWSWEGKFLCFSDTNSTLMATRILWKFDCYPINHCDTFLAHHWLTSFWHQFKFVLTKKILWQQNFVPRFSLFCYVYPKWAISFQTQVFLYGNSPNPLFFNLGPPFFQDWLNFSQPAFLKRPLYFRGKPSPFFLPSNVFPDIGSVGQVEKKNHKESWDSRPWYPRTTLKVNIHIFGLTKCTIYCEKCSCFCSCFSLCCYCAHFSD